MSFAKLEMSSSTHELKAKLEILREVEKIGAHVQEWMEIESFYRAFTLLLFCIAMGRPLFGLFCVWLLWNISVHTAPGFKRMNLIIAAAIKMMELLGKGRIQEPYPPGQEFAEEARRRAHEAKQRAAQTAQVGAKEE